MPGRFVPTQDWHPLAMTARAIDLDAPQFPPRAWQDIEAYPIREVVEGFSDGYDGVKAGDPVPGSNRSPAYRWGYQNAIRDHQAKDDGFDAIRHEYVRERRLRDPARVTEGRR